MTIKNTRIEVWELPPGASEGSHVHEGNDTLEEFYYFIAGRGRRKTPAMLPPVPISTNWPTTAPPTIHQPRKTPPRPLPLRVGDVEVWEVVDPRFMEAW